ncbi:TorF family putative porin [Massilia sp. G4R7]|uniref:TorF family putative porin n=1 Tax=Massilia phyllostachyos TaxID=2898585 RepID=A0ABS8Q9A6_9BURK|nr:TorF family putative porin [Massilia phyllostachyos]MCD2518340.1 TorF family putative porin [Massilia phyllostachyos]
MKYKTSAAAVCWAILALSSVPAFAQEATPDHSVSYNASITSDYRYRGLSQTRLNGAVQGGVDYTHNPTGVYVGTWLSTIRWTKDLGGDGNIEWDVYGGKRGNLTENLTYDVGGLYYYYPSNDLNPSANTFELYARLGFGPAYVKYSHSTTNLFGTANSKRSGYLDLGADIDIGDKMLLNLHAGRQEVNNNGIYSYTDYKAGITKDFGVASVSFAWVRASTKAYLSPEGKDLGRSTVVLSLSKTF